MKTNILFLALIMLFALTTTNCKKDESTSSDDEVFELVGKFVYSKDSSISFELNTDGTGILNGRTNIYNLVYYLKKDNVFTIDVDGLDVKNYVISSDKNSFILQYNEEHKYSK